MFWKAELCSYFEKFHWRCGKVLMMWEAYCALLGYTKLCVVSRHEQQWRQQKKLYTSVTFSENQSSLAASGFVGINSWKNIQIASDEEVTEFALFQSIRFHKRDTFIILRRKKRFKIPQLLSHLETFDV